MRTDEKPPISETPGELVAGAIAFYDKLSAEARAGIISSETRAECAEWDAKVDFGGEFLKDAGFEDIKLEFQENLTRKFRKEGTLHESELRFQVDLIRATEPGGEDKLILSKRYHMLTVGAYTPSIYSIEHNQRPSRRGDLDLLRKASGEYCVSKVAALLDYPVPKAYLLQMGGMPYVGYDYYHGAQDVYGLDLEKMVENPQDVYTRPFFNMLTGSIGDGSAQGIVDLEGVYHAVDVSLSLQYPFTADEMVVGYRKGEYGIVPGAGREHIANFIEKAQGLTLEQARSTLTGYLCTEAEKDKMAEELIRRVKLLPEVYVRLTEEKLL